MLPNSGSFIQLEAEILLANEQFDEAETKLKALEGSIDREVHGEEYEDVLSLLEELFTQLGNPELATEYRNARDDP